MRKSIVVALVCLATSSAPALADQFCAGFERGYALGYMRSSGSGLEPLSPLCPLQPMKSLSDPDSDYEHGVVIGMEQGMAEGQANLQ